MASSPQEIPESPEDNTCVSAGPCPIPHVKTSAEHCEEVVTVVEHLYAKRAKYNKEWTEILQMEQKNIAEQEHLKQAQETIDRAIAAIKERREKLDKAVETHKKREQEAQAVLQEIDEGISQMNEQIKIAFLD